jgi:predicted porin
MKEDGFIYATSFVEFFYQDDNNVKERYAQRYWIRLGLGYKLNQNWRFEVLYNRQDSKSTINTSFDELSKQNIFVIAARHQLNKTKK